MRVALVNGMCTKHDAISNAVVAEYSYLHEKFGSDGVKFYGYSLDYTGWNHKIVQSSAQIFGDDYFLSADLVIYHFGIFYELFNVVLLGNGKAKQLACYHNVTPKKLLGARHHAVIDKSMVQQCNLHFADHVYCDSPFNRDCLLDIGIPAAKLSVMGLPVELAGKQKLAPLDSGTLQLLFIGRIVPSKGVLELLAALRQCVSRGSINFALKIVGNLRFSDEAYIREVHEFLDMNTDLAKHVEFMGEVDDVTKQGILALADALVLPTHHEGFCVPIVEAMAAGCYVISYNNSNVSHVMGGLGTLINTGDVSALSDAISVLCAEWRRSAQAGREPVFENNLRSWSRPEFIANAHNWAEQFSPSRHKSRFLSLVERFGSPS